MDGGAKKEEPSLPPNYVSLAQLQERWLQKQQERKQRKKQEEEKKGGVQSEGAPENDGREKMAAGFVRDDLGRKVEKDGGELGGIRGKGKEIVIGGFENGEENKKKNGRRRAPEIDGREKMAAEFVRDDLGRRMEKDGAESGGIRGKGREIVIGGFENGEENKKKNGRRKKKEKRCFEKRKSDEKGKEVEKEKARIESKEFDSGDGCEGVEIVAGDWVNVGSQGVLSGESSRGGRVDGELEGNKEIASVFRVVDLPRYGVKEEIPHRKRMDFRGGLGRNGDEQGLRYESDKEYRGRLNGLKQNESMFGLERKREDEKGYGKNLRERGKNVGHWESSNRLKASVPDVLKGNEVEPESEKKTEDEILEVCSERRGVTGRDRNGVRSQSNNGRNKMRERRVEGEGSNDNRVALEKKVDHEILAVESAKNWEKGGVGNGYRRYGNSWGNGGEGRRYARSGRYDNHRRMKQKESSMMWVKKEEKSGTDAAEVGCSGISVDQE